MSPLRVSTMNAPQRSSPSRALILSSIVVELQAAERVVARERGRDQCKVSPERQATQEPGAEGDSLDVAAHFINTAEVSASGIEHPELPFANLGEWGIDKFSVTMRSVSPSMMTPPSCRRSRLPSTTSLRLTALTNLGQPSRIAKPFHRVEGDETRIVRIDEHDLSALVDGDLVDVEVASGLGVARYLEPVELLVGHLTLLEPVLRTPDLGRGQKRCGLLRSRRRCANRQGS